jgi:hypothetical protein
MRLSVACTATDAEFQNKDRIIIRDHTMNRQPVTGLKSLRSASGAI